MSRHRPTYLIWIAGRYLACCTCHYGRPVTMDRPLPDCSPTMRRAS